MNPELKKICERVLELKKKATQVTGWYPHSQYDSYRPGCATVRGPGFRWFVVERGTEDYQKHLADQYDDAEFCAFAMNHIVELAQALLHDNLIARPRPTVKLPGGELREQVRLPVEEAIVSAPEPKLDKRDEILNFSLLGD